MEFSRAEYWNRNPSPSPGDLPNPGIKPKSPTLQVNSLSAEPQGNREKKARQGYILSSCLFNLYVEHIMQNARLNEAQAGIKITGRNINIL